MTRIILLSVVLAACIGARAAEPDGDALPPLRVVKIAGVESAIDYMRPAWTAKPEEGEPGALLARDGDLLFLDTGSGEFVLRYREADRAALAVKAEGTRLVLGGKVVAVKLPAETAWLRAASREDLLALRHIEFEGAPGEADLPLLGRIAEANRDLGIIIEGEMGWDGPTFARVLTLFSPRWLVARAAMIEAQADAIISALQRVDLLALNTDGAKSLAWLARLPALRSLFICEWKPGETGPLPAGCARLRAVTFFLLEDAGSDLAFAGDLKRLRELFVVGDEDLSDIGKLAGASNLESLSLAGCEKVTDLSVLRRLPNLTWLGLPPEISQEAFAEIVREHPKLRGLELLKTEKIDDLAPLRDAGAVEMLVLSGTPATTTPLWGKENLRFLALPQETVASSPEYVRAFAKAHPETTVTVATPFCLGSGWILLLPLGAALTYGMLRRRGSGSALHHG
ncbi:MAG: hypothetical protein JXP34_14770 [Planctomycetes bacterium]|nr:hypothetical protein [Planctomycetota bacterium]